MKRKIAAILAADVAEYSRLVAEDEEQALRQLVASVEVFKASIETHGGRIFNMAGDAVLAEFQSAVEAVRSAIDIQERLSVRNEDYAPNRRMLFRMGISIGDVVENGDDLLGDGVNIAARLQTLSQPGGLAISKWVQEQVAGKVQREFRDIGPQIVKNMPAPVHVFRSIPAAGAPAAAKVRKTRQLVSPETMARIWGIASLVAGIALLGGVIALFALNRPQPESVANRVAPPAAAKLENSTPRPAAIERLREQPAPTPPQTPAFLSPEQIPAPKDEKTSVAPPAAPKAALPPFVAPAPAPTARQEPFQTPAPAPSAPTQAAVPPPAADRGNTGFAQDVRPPASAAPPASFLAQDAAADGKQKKNKRCAEVLERAQLGDLTSDDQAFLRSNCR